MKYVSILALFVLSFVSCKKDTIKQSTLIDFIPNNPSVIISASSINDLSEQLDQNDLIQQFNNTNTYKELQQQFSFCKTIKSNNELLISYATVGKKLEFLLSIKENKDAIIVETEGTPETYNNVSYNKLKGQKAYTTYIDSTLIVSSSEILLENLIRNKEDNIRYNNESLLKLYQTSAPNKTTIFINNEKKPKFLSQLLPLSFLSNKDWMSLELDNSSNFFFNGTVTSNHVTHDFATNLIGTHTEESDADKIIPSNFTNYTAFGFESIANFDSQFENFNDLIDNCSEIISANNQNDYLYAFKLLNTDISENLILSSAYRNVDIYKNEHYKIPTSIARKQPEYACLIDDFLVLSNTTDGIQNCIAHYQNKTTLKNLNYFKEQSATLLNESHIINSIKTSNLIKDLSSIIEDESITKVKLQGYPLLTHQITYEDHYIHFNSVINKASKQKSTASISQVANITLEADIATTPTWVKNHKTNEQEIAVQDVNNKLYLISNKGTILWEKQLNGKIQGTIHQVDLYKNKKLQLAFTTDNEFMVLDRNGKLVKPFHKKFNDGNLAPLSVFDYDNNRNYRFLITQGSKLSMYNNKFEFVKGFKFNKASSNIITSPQHIRIGSKDYIVVTEANGKLHILDRKGKTRTKVKSNFAFDNATPILKKKNSLIFKDKENTINTVNIATGKVDKTNILQGSTTYFNNRGNIQVKLEDHKLTINKHTIELDYGNYTAPEIFYLNKKYYITTTDVDTQKVFAFDSNAKTLPKFPIYGQSKISLCNMDKDAKLEFAVQGDTNAILIYKMY